MSKCCDEKGLCRICKTPTVVRQFKATDSKGRPKLVMGRVCPNPTCPNHR